jgi:hypothetical protein
MASRPRVPALWQENLRRRVLEPTAEKAGMLTRGLDGSAALATR